MIFVGLLEFIIVMAIPYLLMNRNLSDEFLLGYAISNNMMLDWWEKPFKKEE